MDPVLVIFAAVGFALCFGAVVLARAFLARVEAQQSAAPAAPHQLVVTLRLAGEGAGTPLELASFRRLEAALAVHLEAQDAGTIASSGISYGAYQLVVEGPDADRMSAIAEPLLRAEPRVPGSHAIRRYGRARREVRVEL